MDISSSDAQVYIPALGIEAAVHVPRDTKADEMLQIILRRVSIPDLIANFDTIGKVQVQQVSQ